MVKKKATKKVTAKKTTKKVTPKNTKVKKTTKKTTKKITKKTTKKKVAKKSPALRSKKQMARKRTTTKKATRKRTARTTTQTTKLSRKPTQRKKASTTPISVEFGAEKYNPQNFFNRDISWLDFNFRVLHEALDERTPLLERLRFMSIWRSNNDEFYMKRVGSLFKKRKEGTPGAYLSGHSAEELYGEMRKKVDHQQRLLDMAFETTLIPELEKEGIKLLKWVDLSDSEGKEVKEYFKRNIFPILTPLAVDSGHPFPFLSNLSKSVGVALRKPRTRSRQFARIKIPTMVPQWIALPKKRNYEFRFINLEEVIMANLDTLFAGMVIDASCIFRVTRNATINEEGDDAEDKMEWVEEGLRERKFAPVVRLEMVGKPDPWLVQFLMTELDLDQENLYAINTLPSYTNFGEIIDIKRRKLKYKRYTPKTPPQFDHKGNADYGLFQMIRKKDALVHYPYESFSSSVETFVKTAAEDPKVMAIKIILYRTDTDGRLIDALIQAAENKKQVACIIELKARFDEERNIQWAQKLEEAGIHVSYGLMELKTHAKMILVVRQDNDRIRSYVNIGTGNYNSQTSRLYTDYGLFTCRKEICDEVLEVFNYLTGRSQKKDYKEILVAPYTMFDQFIAMIKNEAANAKAGKPARIIAKMNQLEEPKIIEELYRASQAGVQIILYIRGFCSLRPGVTGVSENIKVYSLVGRLLEHSRIYYFQNAKKSPRQGLFYLGSADWMHRNLFDRVEVIAPIKPNDLKQELWEYLSLLEKDNRHLWELKSDGTYVQRHPSSVGKEINSQVILLKEK